jgi:hypothetical protein
MPSDVRKVYDLPSKSDDFLGLRPTNAGVARKIFGTVTVGRSHHRTSGGTAGEN